MQILDFLKKNKLWIIFCLLLALHLFLRFYEIETRNSFGWDQVDNAWAAKNIIVDQQLPLVGPFAKGSSSGIRLGPAYYYLITPFYWIFNLDPIAAGVFAGVTSIFTFFVLFYVCKKLFSFNVALIATFINAVAFYGITFDRVQWNVNFIPSISLLIFYSLYKVIAGNEKFLIPLALAMGFFFQVHLTAVFFPLIILLCLPLFPKTKKLIKYGLIALPLFVAWLIPNLVANLQSSGAYSGNFIRYLGTYYHGFHLTRVLQLTHDAFIQFEPFFTFSILKSLKFILIPLFVFVYLFRSASKEKLVFCYLIILWFLVPWFVLATYSGEISDYYFSINRFIALLVLAVLIGKLYRVKNWLVKVAVVIFLIYYASFNINQFLATNNNKSLKAYKENVMQAIKEGRVIQFQEGAPESYLYYIYTRKK